MTRGSEAEPAAELVGEAEVAEAVVELIDPMDVRPPYTGVVIDMAAVLTPRMRRTRSRRSA